MSGGKRIGPASAEAVRQVLRRDWDPIGVGEIPEAQDEYDGYVGDICLRLAEGAGAEEVARHLAGIETKAMGLSRRPPETLMRVARQLCDLNVRYDGD